MALDKIIPGMKLEEKIKYEQNLKKRKSRIYKAICTTLAILAYMGVQFWRNHSEAELINKILQTPEVVNRYNSYNLSTPTFLRDFIGLELISYRGYVERFDTSDGKLLSSKGMSNMNKIVKAKKLAKDLEDQGASGLTDVLLSATNVKSLDTVAWTPRMIRFQDAVSEVDLVLNNITYMEKLLFERSEYAQITKTLRDRGSTNPNGDYLNLRNRRKDYFLSALPAMMFENKIMMMIVPTMWQAETKSDETASGIVNPLDTGKGQFQVDTAIDYLFKLILYPEFDYMMRSLRPVDEDGKVMDWSEYGKRLKANKSVIARLNRMNQGVRNLESDISDLTLDMRNESDKHTLTKSDSIYYSAKIGEKKTALASIIESMKNDKEAREVEYLYRILFEEKLQAVLTGFYVREVFNMQIFWSAVKEYYYGSQKTNNPTSLKQATLETLYCTYINGPGALKTLMNARRKNNFNREYATNDDSVPGHVRHAIRHSVRLYQEYSRIEKLINQGLFVLSNKSSDIKTINKYVIETPDLNFDSLSRVKMM